VIELRRVMMKSKIHRATVTGAEIDYEGSVTIDAGLMSLADILPWEQVHVLDVTNGARLTTYAIPGEQGAVRVNGAAARKVDVGDVVIIIAYASCSQAELDGFRPRIVRLDRRNRVVEGGGPDLAPGMDERREPFTAMMTIDGDDE